MGIELKIGNHSFRNIEVHSGIDLGIEIGIAIEVGIDLGIAIGVGTDIGTGIVVDTYWHMYVNMYMPYIHMQMCRSLGAYTRRENQIDARSKISR